MAQVYLIKASIDVLRESPALEIVKQFVNLDMGEILIFEPNIKKLPSILGKVVNLYTIVKSLLIADVIVVFVDHKEFKSIDFCKYPAELIADARGTTHEPAI